MSVTVATLRSEIGGFKATLQLLQYVDEPLIFSC